MYWRKAELDRLNRRHEAVRIDQLRGRAALGSDRVRDRREVGVKCQKFRHQKLPPFAFVIVAAAHAPLDTRKNFPLSEAVTSGRKVSSPDSVYLLPQKPSAASVEWIHA